MTTPRQDPVAERQFDVASASLILLFVALLLFLALAVR